MTSEPTPMIHTDRLIIRLPEMSDISSVLEYYTENKDFLAPWEPIRPESFYTERFWRRHVLESELDFREGRAVRFFLFDRFSPSKIVGYIVFSQMVQRVAWYCILGYSLAQKHQGRGLMTEALEEAITFVFDEFNMHRIMSNYMPHNQRSGAVLRRLGFTVEGYARDYLMINGQWEDHILTSLRNPDWHDPYAV